MTKISPGETIPTETLVDKTDGALVQGKGALKNLKKVSATIRRGVKSTKEKINKRNRKALPGQTSPCSRATVEIKKGAPVSRTASGKKRFLENRGGRSCFCWKTHRLGTAFDKTMHNSGGKKLGRPASRRGGKLAHGYGGKETGGGDGER